MQGERTYVMTGATSGMGLVLARKLAQSAGTRLVVGARTPALASALRRVVPANRLTLLELDLANLGSVAQFCNRAAEVFGRAATVDAIVCNAGLQITSGRRMTADGVEMTFAANHLGHFQLVHRLLPMMRRGGLVVATASGTHDPSDPLASRFGFRGGIFSSAEAVARGDLDASQDLTQQGMDHYATSKLCNILFIKEMARRMTDLSVAGPYVVVLWMSLFVENFRPGVAKGFGWVQAISAPCGPTSSIARSPAGGRADPTAPVAPTTMLFRRRPE